MDRLVMASGSLDELCQLGQELGGCPVCIHDDWFIIIAMSRDLPRVMPPERVAECVRTAGIGFLFAPLLHGAMKHAIGPRREIGIRTVFNILGPLTNPAGANVQLTGVFDPKLTKVLAEVLVRLGMKRAIIVWGEGGLDEMTVTGATHLADGHDGSVEERVITPEELGLKRATMDDIKGGATPAESAAQVRAVLSGESVS